MKLEQVQIQDLLKGIRERLFEVDRAAVIPVMKAAFSEIGQTMFDELSAENKIFMAEFLIRLDAAANAAELGQQPVQTEAGMEIIYEED